MSESESRMGADGREVRGEPLSSLPDGSDSPLRHIFSVVLVALVTIWLYRRALTFAFFNDDPTGHFAWMEGQSILQFFTGSAGYGYYRPAVFAFLRLFQVLFGSDVFPHSPVADHALLMFLHATNSALVWALARRLGRSDAFASVAALVFAFVPFSYEAVAYVASLTHPLLVFWVLMSLLLYDRGRRVAAIGKPGNGGDGEQSGQSRPSNGRWYLAGSGVSMMIGLLSHENGLFIFPALVGLDWVTQPGATLRDRFHFLWPFALPPILFFGLWVTIPKNSEQLLNNLGDVDGNVVPFLQTLVYPLLPLVRLDVTEVWFLATLAVGVVALFGVLAWRVCALRLWAFGVGWFALAALPALLFLSPAYVYGSPRLSYLPSIGVALLWGIPVLWLRNRVYSGKPLRAKRSAVLLVVTVIYALTLILPPLPFIHCQLDFYAETSRFARDMASTASAAPPDRDIVFINTPFFFSSTAVWPDGCPSPYPWTPVGGILIPPYAQARDFVRFNGGPDRAVSGVTYTGYSPGWRTFGVEIDGDTLRRYVTEDTTYVFDLLSGTLVNLSAIWLPDAGWGGLPLVSFGDTLDLTNSTILQDGEWLAVQLEWGVVSQIDTPLAAFVHIYDANGALVAQSDRPPGGGFAPQALWQVGDSLVDERRIDLTSLPPGEYTVAVGVYNTTDGERLAAQKAGKPLAYDIYPVRAIRR